ncbi:hypothetical protein TSTA_007890 [Talaromyces stipitatus ATCC 10500]|uniref:Reverse transcriptase Ty1/copia-type domain-containing protein n=1 Tax=Talaromyces stipitatus (strain ATCC 10500 / CBS 375.48 / QM 6759 / NRRL 1006) TaxID=441959 RepID=B8MVH8_TALSN|nr:uncharacterized protein TSTA_007890 [Talaromyces stipitatus ATCC 10500]EED11499.1 hypothetical protein TSTA_007890 [Talaromyces stipitatus ATCC 10500]
MRTNQLITPLTTPPTTPLNQTTGQEAPRAQEISANLSESNIVAGSRIRKASNRALSPTSISAGPSKTSKRDRSPEPSPISRKRQRKLSRAFLARQKLLQDSTTDKIFLAAMEKLEEPFSVQLPPEPKNWKGVFKAHICVRGDLQQPNDLEKQAATLAARNFRMMMAIAAIFDLKIVQYDAMNAFVNSILDEEVYTYFPDGFKQDGQLCQDSQITKMASKFGINATNNVKTPISGNIEASTEQATNEEIHAYQELMGSALYIAIMTRVDVAKAVNELAKHTKNPLKAYFQ